MTRFTYIPTRERSPTPEPEKPKYYYSYENDSAGRLSSAPPKNVWHCHCHQQDEPAAPSPSHPYVCYHVVPSSAHLHASPAYVCYPGSVETPKQEPKCVCYAHPTETPNVPAYCLPETQVMIANNHADVFTDFVQSKKAETDPVIHMPRNVTYTYPAHGRSSGQFYHPHYMCYSTGYGQAVPNAIPWQGSSREEVDIQNRAIHYEHLDQVVPYQEAPADHQYWCKELDGSFTLRTLKEIGDECRVGHWQLSKENHWYWMRE